MNKQSRVHKFISGVNAYELPEIQDKTRESLNGCLDWTGDLRRGMPYQKFMKKHFWGLHVRLILWVIMYGRDLPENHATYTICGRMLCVRGTHIFAARRGIWQTFEIMRETGEDIKQYISNGIYLGGIRRREKYEEKPINKKNEA